MRNLIITTAALAALTASVALAQELAGGAIMSSEIGGENILTDAGGMTLYTYDKDLKGISNCTGECAENWPPLIAEASSGAGVSGDFKMIQRDDGQLQWAYKDMPLYTWIKDENPGDTTGDGVGGVWRAAVHD